MNKFLKAFRIDFEFLYSNIYFRTEREKWKEKVIVENIQAKTHKLSGATELKEVGFSSSNQIDKLKGLLKDEPKKLGLLAGG